MKTIITIIAVLFFVGCATVTPLQPKETDIQHMQEKVPGLTLEDAQRGFKLYKYNCAGCHNLHKPTEFTPEGWKKILPEMLGKAKISSEKDRELLKNYLLAKSK